jgi:hypothetical protein
MSDSDPLRPPAPPPWLRPDTHAAMQLAYDREVAAGRDPATAAAAACAVLLARVAGPASAPSRPEGGAKAATAGEHGAAAPSGCAPQPHAPPRHLDEAEVADLVQALAYALRYDERGRPRKGGWDFAAELAAEHLAGHLRRANFVVLRRRPGPPHRAG